MIIQALTRNEFFRIVNMKRQVILYLISMCETSNVIFLALQVSVSSSVNKAGLGGAEPLQLSFQRSTYTDLCGHWALIHNNPRNKFGETKLQKVPVLQHIAMSIPRHQFFSGHERINVLMQSPSQRFTLSLMTFRLKKPSKDSKRNMKTCAGTRQRASTAYGCVYVNSLICMYVSLHSSTLMLLCAHVYIVCCTLSVRVGLNALCTFFTENNPHNKPTKQILFVPFSRFKKQSLEMEHNLSRVTSEEVTKQEFKLQFIQL